MNYTPDTSDIITDNELAQLSQCSDYNEANERSSMVDRCYGAWYLLLSVYISVTLRTPWPMLISHKHSFLQNLSRGYF
jgi:hypothetical protein